MEGITMQERIAWSLAEISEGTGLSLAYLPSEHWEATGFWEYFAWAASFKI